MNSYLPLGIPPSTKLPSAFVTVPLELPLRNTLTPTSGLPVAESLTDPVMILFCAWAKKQEAVNRAINRDKILFMEYREIYAMKIKQKSWPTPIPGRKVPCLTIVAFQSCGQRGSAGKHCVYCRHS